MDLFNVENSPTYSTPSLYVKKVSGRIAIIVKSIIEESLQLITIVYSFVCFSPILSLH